MSDEIKFLAHFVGLKYLKSTGTWRLELDLFEKDVDIVPEHVRHVNKVVNIQYSEYKDGMVESEDLQSMLEDAEIQTLLGTNGVEETKEALESRTGVNFDNLTIKEINDIIKKVYKSIGGGNE